MLRILDKTRYSCVDVQHRYWIYVWFVKQDHDKIAVNKLLNNMCVCDKQEKEYYQNVYWRINAFMM